MIRKIGVALIIAFMAIQFFRPEKNNSAIILPTDITRTYAVPQNVQRILQKACADCHSNNTEYPWYSYIQPVAWFLQDHIKEGKKELNYSEFGTYSITRQNKKMDETMKEIKDDDMPLSSYTFMHPSARLTDAEKNVLYDWCKSIQGDLKARYPADSLLIKK